MSVQRYIGLEEELISFEWNGKKYERIDFDDYRTIVFKEIIGKSYKSLNGNNYYVDGCELEINTPPISLNKGFATRLTNSLVIGRNTIIKNTPNLRHTGYSMHWNLTRNILSEADSIFQEPDFRNGLIIPFQMLGLTPLSMGTKFTIKSYIRRHLAGESIRNENQIKAMALMLGAYDFSKEKMLTASPFPKFISCINDEERSSIIHEEESTSLPNLIGFTGRDTLFPVEINDKEKEISAQDYLEQFYKWIKPFVLELGTKEEIKNLEDFISGKKRLEMDEKAYFEYIKKYKIYEDGIYLPFKTSFLKKENERLLTLSKFKKQPVEAKIIQEIAQSEKTSGCEGWANWEIMDKYGNYVELKNIESIYNYGNSLLKKGEKRFKPSLNLEYISSNSIDWDQFTKIREGELV